MVTAPKSQCLSPLALYSIEIYYNHKNYKKKKQDINKKGKKSKTSPLTKPSLSQHAITNPKKSRQIRNTFNVPRFLSDPLFYNKGFLTKPVKGYQELPNKLVFCEIIALHSPHNSLHRTQMPDYYLRQLLATQPLCYDRFNYYNMSHPPRGVQT